MATIDTIRPINQNFAAYANDNWVWSVDVFSDSSLSTPVDLVIFTGIELKVRAFRGNGSNLVLADLTSGLSVSVNTLFVDVNLTVDRAGKYEYDIQGTTATGEISTIIQGQIETTLDV